MLKKTKSLSVIYALLTFIGTLVGCTLIWLITYEIFGPGLISTVVNLAMFITLFYVPYKIYKLNENSKTKFK
jgi:hypothetical protein